MWHIHMYAREIWWFLSNLMSYMVSNDILHQKQQECAHTHTHTLQFAVEVSANDTDFKKLKQQRGAI